jgi:hypothetical protein
MFESDADRLAMIRAVGEQFDTGKPTRMWAVFDEAYLESDLDRFTVANREPMLQVRTSDVALHELVKASKLTRVSDGSDYFVKDLEPDGTGMTLVRLRK